MLIQLHPFVYTTVAIHVAMVIYIQHTIAAFSVSTCMQHTCMWSIVDIGCLSHEAICYNKMVYYSN